MGFSQTLNQNHTELLALLMVTVAVRNSNIKNGVKFYTKNYLVDMKFLIFIKIKTCNRHDNKLLKKDLIRIKKS